MEVATTIRECSFINNPVITNTQQSLSVNQVNNKRPNDDSSKKDDYGCSKKQKISENPPINNDNSNLSPNDTSQLPVLVPVNFADSLEYSSEKTKPGTLIVSPIDEDVRLSSASDDLIYMGESNKPGDQIEKQKVIAPCVPTMVKKCALNIDKYGGMMIGFLMSGIIASSLQENTRIKGKNIDKRFRFVLKRFPKSWKKVGKMNPLMLVSLSIAHYVANNNFQYNTKTIDDVYLNFVINFPIYTWEQSISLTYYQLAQQNPRFFFPGSRDPDYPAVIRASIVDTLTRAIMLAAVDNFEDAVEKDGFKGCIFNDHYWISIYVVRLFRDFAKSEQTTWTVSQLKQTIHARERDLNVGHVFNWSSTAADALSGKDIKDKTECNRFFLNILIRAILRCTDTLDSVLKFVYDKFLEADLITKNLLISLFAVVGAFYGAIQGRGNLLVRKDIVSNWLLIREKNSVNEDWQRWDNEKPMDSEVFDEYDPNSLAKLRKML